jgi:hypothetical protein
MNIEVLHEFVRAENDVVVANKRLQIAIAAVTKAVNFGELECEKHYLIGVSTVVYVAHPEESGPVVAIVTESLCIGAPKR